MAYLIRRDWEVNPGFDFGPNKEWLSRLTRSTDPEVPSLDSEPLSAFLESRKRLCAPPDVVGWARTFLVSAASKAVIERLEPGIHDFIPCEAYYMLNNKYSMYEYFVVRLNIFIDDPVDIDQCDCLVSVRPDGKRIWIKDSGKPLALKANVIKGKHLYYYAELFCSDELHDALTAGGLGIGWTFEKQIVI